MFAKAGTIVQFFQKPFHRYLHLHTSPPIELRAKRFFLWPSAFCVCMCVCSTRNYNTSSTMSSYALWLIGRAWPLLHTALATLKEIGSRYVRSYLRLQSHHSTFPALNNVRTAFKRNCIVLVALLPSLPVLPSLIESLLY